MNAPTATTELQAINAMLSAVGEAPVSTLESPPTTVEMAQNILRAVLLDVLAYGWRFNTEWGYRLSPVGTLGGANVFTPPANLLDFKTSRSPDQLDLDLVIRPSVSYTPAGTMIFYDRAKNSETIPLDTLRIDPVWSFGFHQIPEVARRYVLVRAARQYAQDTRGDAELANFKITDEQMALITLTKREGRKDNYNIFNNPDVAMVHGRRGQRPLYLRMTDLRGGR